MDRDESDASPALGTQNMQVPEPIPRSHPVRNADETNAIDSRRVTVFIRVLLTENLRAVLPFSCNSAARRSWVLRGVIHGFSEEARTRGFPSPPFGGFGFFGVAGNRIIADGWQLSSWSPMSASRPESLSQAASAILSKGDPRCCNVLRYLASSYGVRVIQQRYKMRIHLNASALTAA